MVKDIFVKRLVLNRTKDVVRCLNAEGNFIELSPMGDVPLPKYELGVCYIVTEEEYLKTKDTERSVLDFVHPIDGIVTGRSNTEFVYLESYEETAIGENVKLRVAPSPESSYERRDPKHEKYHILSV